MAISVERIDLIESHHYDGDEFWDGDQSLYEAVIAEGQIRESMLFVVARGDGFVRPHEVVDHIEHMGLPLVELRALAESPAEKRRPQVRLAIEPGEAVL